MLFKNFAQFLIKNCKLNRQIKYILKLDKFSQIQSFYTTSFNCRLENVEKIEIETTKHRSLNEFDSQIKNIIDKYGNNNVNSFETLLVFLFEEIEKLPESPLFKAIFSNDLNFCEFKDVILRSIKHKIPAYKDAYMIEFFEIKTIEIIFNRQQMYNGKNFNLKKLYYNLFQNYYYHIIKIGDIKFKLLETRLNSLITHYHSILLFSNEPIEKDLEEISNNINETNEILFKKLPKSVTQSVDSPLNLLIIQSMFYTKNNFKKAQDFFINKLIPSLELKKNRMVPTSLLISSYISIIMNNNDLRELEEIANKALFILELIYPIHLTLSFSYVVNMSVFRHFKSKNIRNDANCLLNCWSKFDYIPKVEECNRFKIWLNDGLQKEGLKINDVIIDTQFDEK